MNSSKPPYKAGCQLSESDSGVYTYKGMPCVLLSFALGEHGIKDTKCLTGNVAPLKNMFTTAMWAVCMCEYMCAGVFVHACVCV